MKKLLPLVFAFALSAVAGPVEDPKGFLKTLESTRAKSTFSEAFRLGDRTTVRIFNKDCMWGCGADGCGSMCTVVNEDFEKKIVEATADSATAATTDGTADVFERADYEAFGNQSFTKALAGLDVFLGMQGKVVLKTMTAIDFALADASKIPAYQIRGDFETKDAPIEFEFIVARGPVPGIAEILFFKVGGWQGEGGDKLFKVKAIARGN